MLSKSQYKAYNMFLNEDNLFITANAGAGKSYLINYIIDNLHDECLLCASTGISATLIGGKTVHSQFLIGWEPDYEESVLKLKENNRLKEIIRAKVLIIDEISMISDKVLDTIDMICRIIRGNDVAFGGLQVIFCGDFLQLPPVFKGNENYCIYSEAWKEGNIKTILLTSNFRQEDDKEFFKILTRIRYNYINNDAIIALKKREIEPDDDVLRLYSTNDKVNEYNDMMFNKLDKSTNKYYKMIITGETSYVNNFIKNSLYIDELNLRLNARVMLLSNEDFDGDYLCNGSLGTVIGFNGGYPLVKFDCGYTKTIEPKTIKQTKKHYDKNGVLVEEKEVLRVEQIPLKLAYAVSIHKSQGQTFDKIYVDCSRAFVNGQIYVALSRVKSLNGLYIKGFNPYRARSNENMVKWYLNLERESRK